MSGNPVIEEFHLDVMLDKVRKIGRLLAPQILGMEILETPNNMELTEEDVIRIFETNVGKKVDSIIEQGPSRNFVFKITSADELYILKVFKENVRGASHVESWAYHKLEQLKIIKKRISAGEDLKLGLNYLITKYIQGKELCSYTEENNFSENDVEKIDSQIFQFIDFCSSIETKGFGRFSKSMEGTQNSWSECVFGYLNNLKDRSSKLSISSKNLMMKYLDFLHDFFEKQKEYLKSVEPRLIPVDLNLSNFLLTGNFNITLLDLESFWSGDPLLAYGDWVGNTYGSSLYKKFEEHLFSFDSNKREIILAYSILSNLSTLLFIAENKTCDLEQANPFGNPNKYIDMLDEHVKNIGKSFFLKRSDAFFEHTSYRTGKVAEKGLLECSVFIAN